MDTRYAFEPASRRTILSEEVELESLKGFHFRARKYSVEASEEINAAKKRRAQAVPKELVSFYAKFKSEISKAKEGGDSFVESLPEAEVKQALEMAANLPDSASSQRDIIRLVLLRGIGEHDLAKDGERTREVDDGLVSAIMENQELAGEMVRIIEAWNGPLARKTS